MQVCVQLPTRLRARLHACKYAHPPARTHARTLQRILSRCFRVPLRPAMGMTDIDQKIVERAAESATTAHTLARHFEVAFFGPSKAVPVSVQLLPMLEGLRTHAHGGRGSG